MSEEEECGEDLGPQAKPEVWTRNLNTRREA